MLLPSNNAQAKWGIKSHSQYEKTVSWIHSSALHRGSMKFWWENIWSKFWNTCRYSQWMRRERTTQFKKTAWAKAERHKPSYTKPFWVIKDILSSISGTLHMLEPVSSHCSFPPSFPFLDASFGLSLAISSPRKSPLTPAVCYMPLLTAFIAPCTSSNQTSLLCFGIICYLSLQWSYKVHRVPTLSFFVVYPKTNTLLGSH